LQKTKGKQLFFEILFALLLLALLIAVLVSELSRASDAYFYESAKLVSYTQSDVLTGYIFREEIAADTLNNGPIDYLAQNGTSVQAGDTLANVYRDDEGSDKRERAAALYAQIAELEAALGVPDWKQSYLTDYTALMRELSAGNTAAAIDRASATATALGGADAQKHQDVLLSRIAALEEELRALSAHTGIPFPTKALKDGTFYRTADGYEALFGINQLDTLTPASLDLLLAAPPMLDNVIGKLVCRGPWYLAVPLTRPLAESYTQGATYPVRFDNNRVTMTLERVYTDDTDRALLIFGTTEQCEWLSPARAQRVSVEKCRTTGLSIPADALLPDNTVFVSEDGVARLRRVTPVLYEQGCVLLSEEDGSLVQGERVIVSAKQLFEGKVLE
jgi:hypothetical protein